MLRIVRLGRSQRRSVLPCSFIAFISTPQTKPQSNYLRIPGLGFRIEIGTTKSDVRIRFFSQSILSPWGENCSPRTLSNPFVSSGNSWMMLRSESVSIKRPGDVPTAEPMYVKKNPPSGFARTSSAIDASSARSLFRKLGLYGSLVSK